MEDFNNSPIIEEESVKDELTPEQLSEYKYGSFSIGDVVRAYDFEPRQNRKDAYVKGEIIDVVRRHGVLFWKIDVSVDSLYDNYAEDIPPRDIVFAPLEGMFDFENRITKLN